MPQEYTKAIKRQIREWAIEAYERELHRELTLLDQSFEEWRQGRISSGELSSRVHDYESGPSRRLFSEYNERHSEGAHVAYALTTGILSPEEVPGEVQEALSSWLGLYGDLQKRDELADPAERLRARQRRR